MPQITAACKSAGFTLGGASTGTGLLADCVIPIMQGVAQPAAATHPLPQVSAQAVAACKARNPRFGQVPTSAAASAPSPGSPAQSLATPASPSATGIGTAAKRVSTGEQQFINSVTRDLQGRLGTTAQAQSAGYFRYTVAVKNVTSWVNPNYWKSDAEHPSELLYTANDKLLAAYFSIPRAESGTKPDLWGMSPSRWTASQQHVHFGVKTPSGIHFGFASPARLTQVGGSVTNPVPQDVVKLGNAKSVSDVAFVFHYPASYVVRMWVVPNSLGPFAADNPSFGATLLDSCKPTDSEPSLWMTTSMYQQRIASTP